MMTMMKLMTLMTTTLMMKLNDFIVLIVMDNTKRRSLVYCFYMSFQRNKKNCGAVLQRVEEGPQKNNFKTL
jgi:hypothetical protein